MTRMLREIKGSRERHHDDRDDERRNVGHQNRRLREGGKFERHAEDNRRAVNDPTHDSPYRGMPCPRGEPDKRQVIVRDHRSNRDVVQAHIQYVGFPAEQDGVQQRDNDDAKGTERKKFAAPEISQKAEQQNRGYHQEPRPGVYIIVGIARRDLQMMDIAVVVARKNQQRQRNDRGKEQKRPRSEVLFLFGCSQSLRAFQKEKAERAEGNSQHHRQSGNHRPLQLQTELQRDRGRVARSDAESRTRLIRGQRNDLRVNRAARKAEKEHAQSRYREIKQRRRGAEQHYRGSRHAESK